MNRRSFIASVLAAFGFGATRSRAPRIPRDERVVERLDLETMTWKPPCRVQDVREGDVFRMREARAHYDGTPTPNPGEVVDVGYADEVCMATRDAYCTPLGRGTGRTDPVWTLTVEPCLIGWKPRHSRVRNAPLMLELRTANGPGSGWRGATGKDPWEPLRA